MGSDNPSEYGLTLPSAMVIASFTTIAWVNTIELQARIWLNFKRHSGLYFWSLLLSSWGCAIHPLAFLLLNFQIWRNPHAVGIFIGISWWCMVTGQALVLYSRLHLVMRDMRKLRWVLYMIITNFFILHLPIMLLSQVVSLPNSALCRLSCVLNGFRQGYSTLPIAPQFLKVYKVYEKVQMTGFTIQELIISGLYLWETRRLLKPHKHFQEAKTREVMLHLVWVNVFIIFLDMALLSTEYANLFTIQTVFKAAIYSIKLRFEFVVLNQLMEIVKGRGLVYELSNNAGNRHASTRGAGGRKALQSVQSHKSGDWTKQGWVAPNHTYSVSASNDLNLKSEQAPEGVLRTTEFVVHDQPLPEAENMDNSHVPHSRSDLSGVAISKKSSNAGRRSMTAHSPTSSEIQFAQKGA